jgi:hypothetical protein
MIYRPRIMSITVKLVVQIDDRRYEAFGWLHSNVRNCFPKLDASEATVEKWSRGEMPEPC